MPSAIAALAITAGGALYKGYEKGQAADYQSQVASNNATIERQNAQYSAAAGASAVERQGLKSAARLSKLRAGIAANGIDVNSGSAAEVQTDQRKLGYQDVEQTGKNAAWQVYGYETQATNQQAQSKLLHKEATNDYIEGALNAAGAVAGSPDFSSLLSGTPSVPEKFSWMQDYPGAQNDEGGGVIY